jgi:predicted DNA-binding transcriptional regulator YafY
MLERYTTLFLSVPSAAKDYSASAEIIEELSLAIIERTICNIRYHTFSDDKVKEYDIQPLHFFEREGGLYLLVTVPTYGDVRTLAVERIKAAEGTGQSFAYPEGFDPEEYLASAFTLYFEEPVEVRIRFAASQARYIRERVWAKEQKIQEADDGSVFLTINTSGWDDIKSWAMSFGVNAEVMEPIKMRQEIATELSAALERYRR